MRFRGRDYYGGAKKYVSFWEKERFVQKNGNVSFCGLYFFPPGDRFKLTVLIGSPVVLSATTPVIPPVFLGSSMLSVHEQAKHTVANK